MSHVRRDSGSVPRVSVVVGRDAPDLERFAAQELCAYLGKLFGVDRLVWVINVHYIAGEEHFAGKRGLQEEQGNENANQNYC